MKRFIPISIVSTLLISCGGGGDGQVVKTSEDCFNEGFLRAGMRISVQKDFRASTGVSYQKQEYYTVSQSASANGVLEATVSGPDYVNTYFSLENGVLKEHKRASAKMFLSVDEMVPPKAFPVRMEIGQTVWQRYLVNSYRASPSGALSSVADGAESRTYVGREVVETPLGAFEVCRFKINEKLIVSDDAQSSTDEEKTLWVVAGGIYRGLVLKSESSVSRPTGERSTTVMEVSKVDTFNVN
ncbi:hypothetical protein [Acidovorax sp. Q11]